MKITTAIMVALLWTLSACNPVEPAPDYLTIPSFTLTTDYLTEGSASHKIVDAWVYIDNDPVGVFAIPAHFPVIREGDSLTIVPGIMERGISNTREPYPFYKSITLPFSYDPATSDTIIPSITYREGLRFPLLEDFEFGNDFSGMTVTSVASQVYEGSKSGTFTLTTSNDSLVAISSAYALPDGGTRVFLEFDYRNEQPFNVLLQANGAQGNSNVEYLITVNPKSTWNKFYVDLTTVVSGLSAEDYQVVFSAALKDTVTTARYYWDNVKIVHF